MFQIYISLPFHRHIIYSLPFKGASRQYILKRPVFCHVRDRPIFTSYTCRSCPVSWAQFQYSTFVRLILSDILNSRHLLTGLSQFVQRCVMKDAVGFCIGFPWILDSAMYLLYSQSFQSNSGYRGLDKEEVFTLLQID